MARQSKYKQCAFCKKRIDEIDFKDVAVIQKYITSWGKIKSIRESGSCAKHQRSLSHAIKRARFMALLAYTNK
ncbi:MAG: 30S ribosomal protein S18 [bacterium]|nr:30S ribosomal protein S18 [bacterium]